jgi:RNA polymerase sigma-70 factor (ECF subfamily)
MTLTPMNESADVPTGQELRRLRCREPAAVEQWFRRNVDDVWAFVVHRVGMDRELALDVVQDVFAQALERIHDYDPLRGTMLAWLTWSARNPIRRALAQRQRGSPSAGSNGRMELAIADAARRLDSARLPDDLLERRETVELVREAIARLPDRYRWALEGHYLEHRSLGELALARGMSEGAVKTLLHRARLAFKEEFQERADRRTSVAPSPRGARHD